MRITFKHDIEEKKTAREKKIDTRKQKKTGEGDSERGKKGYQEHPSKVLINIQDDKIYEDIS